MPKKEYKEADKKKFGKAIKKAREALPKGSNSQRYIAEQVGIPNSTLKSFEDGNCVPTPKIYMKLIEELKPNDKSLCSIEKHYCDLKGTPPPDVCKSIMNNAQWSFIIRSVENKELSKEQLENLLDKITIMVNMEK